MPAYNGKLLELKSIKKISNKTFLEIKLSFKEELDIYLEIDEFTSRKINTIIEGDKRYKYRLSFNNYFDSISQQYRSTVTKTYLNNSQHISFPCSEEYVTILSSIKIIEDIHNLDKLSFVHRNLESINEKQEVRESTQDIKTKSKIHKPLKLAFLSLSLILIMFFSFLNTLPSDGISINKKSLAESIHTGHGVDVKREKTLDLDAETQPIIPFIELDQRVTYGIPKGNIALTFDDGPSQYSVEIVNVLKEYQVGATFFFIGQNVVKYPDHVKYVQSNGYSIGSHSTNHLDIPTLSHADQEIELVQSIELLREFTNEEVTLFRPPYGTYSDHLIDLIHENDYKMVLWNNDPEDWKTRDSDKIFDDIQNSYLSGSIILLHESQAVIDALPRIIEYLQDQELDIVNLK